LDCELLPWSAKAQELLKQQYAAVGASARASLAAEVAALTQASARGLDAGDLLLRTQQRQQMVSDYVEAYRRYCWRVESVKDLKLAPFHLLATEGKVHADKPHDWHMETLRSVCAKLRRATLSSGDPNVFVARHTASSK
jgi:protein phosphatase